MLWGQCVSHSTTSDETYDSRRCRHVVQDDGRGVSTHSTSLSLRLMTGSSQKRHVRTSLSYLWRNTLLSFGPFCYPRVVVPVDDRIFFLSLLYALSPLPFDSRLSGLF
jgi:hypothetical protein